MTDFPSGLKLLLVRHGTPDFVPPARVDRNEVSTVLSIYPAPTVAKSPPASLIHTMNEHQPAVTVTSDLPRALSSARAPGLEPFESSALWAEADLLHPDRLPMPLPWSTLLVLCRLAWFAGYTRNAAGRAADRERARAGADRFVEFAGEHETVVLVAHDIINRLIRTELASRGWRAMSRTGDGYCSCALLRHGP